MRVLHVVSTGMRRGAEVFAADLVRTLAGSGLDQHVAVLQPDGRAVRYDAPTTYLPAGGVRLPGVRLDVSTTWGLRNLMRQVTPDVIQAHGGATIKYVLAADSAGRASSVVLRSIGLAPPQVTRGLRRQAWKRISDRAAKVIAVADAVRAQAIGTFQIEPARVVTIPNAVDPSRLRTARSPGEIRSSLGLPPAAEVVTSIGALTWEKDPRSVVEVADRVLRARQDEALFLLVGEGPLEPSVRSAIDRRGLTGRVRLLGTRPDVAEILAATDVLLLASCTEGMPGCLIEAAMAGVPVVAYAVGGVPEVVVDAATGRLAPPGHVGALANLVVELLRDVKGRAAMGARARELCRDRFDIKAVAPAYAAVYQEVGG